MANKYHPNFNDPRVIRRTKRAIGFVYGVMSETKPREWSTRYIDKHLGSQRNELSKFLRENLLICVDDSYKFNSGDRGICKKYLLNKTGLEFLLENLKRTTIQLYPIVVEVAKNDHLVELTTGNFEYSDKSSRLWHPLQRYRKQIRTQILVEHGYQHHYDISTCAPMLIHQKSQLIPEIINDRGRWLQGPMDLYLFALRRYLTDKDQVRKELAINLELPITAVKELINALFAGAVISKHKDSDIYEILNGDIARIECLKQNSYIKELVSDIKVCWSYLRPMIPVRTKTNNKTNRERLLPVTSKQKWHLYFELERRVMDAVTSFLSERNVKYFLIHDGWNCDREIDRNELSEFVRNKTGFDLKFDYLKL